MKICSMTKWNKCLGRSPHKEDPSTVSVVWIRGWICPDPSVPTTVVSCPPS